MLNGILIIKDRRSEQSLEWEVTGKWASVAGSFIKKKTFEEISENMTNF